KLQPLVKQGDPIAGVPTNSSTHLFPGVLTDLGQLAFYAGPDAGSSGALFLFANGTFTPLVVKGQNGPSGPWIGVVGALPNMNQRGNLAFAAPVTREGKTSMGTFFWVA